MDEVNLHQIFQKKRRSQFTSDFFKKNDEVNLHPFLIFGTDVVMIVIVMNVIKHFG